MGYKIRTAVPADEGKIRELFLEMLRTIYHTDDVKGYGDGDLDRLGYVKDYSTHPIRTLVENEVRVTINTDDLLIFDSTIENEYLKLYRAGTLSVDQLDEIRRAGLGTGWRS